MMKKLLATALLALTLQTGQAQDITFGKPVSWDRHSLLIDGRRVTPVMGEVHYSRIPADEWERAVQQIKEGGVNIIATYVFWNHIEEQEGIYRWDGQRSLRRFLEICRQHQMPVILRVGPFCHGEVRCGGMPDWLFSKGCKVRSTDPQFLAIVERLYRQIFTQMQGLQWRDGGPLLACQFDNEYRGSGEYLMALKRIATRIGFDLPFYTRTGWPKLSRPVPFGEMLPLYGDYADGFWDKSILETAGNYYKAFQFKAFRSSTAIGTDLLGQQKEETAKGDDDYPYFTCELGGGMATAYHRRPFIYPEDAYSMAIVKLGSGSNLLGYYMYHGGTNPESSTGITLNESVHTLSTANNDLPVKTYDFQAPLGEFGQRYPHYYMLRRLHLFMHDWGDVLAPMEASFPGPTDKPKGYDDSLRWSVRSNGQQGFIFINNYERLQQLKAKPKVRLSACSVTLPRLTIPAGAMAIFPVNIDGIRYATAQLLAKRDGRIYMQQIEGIPTTIAMSDGKTLRNVKPQGTAKPVYQNIYLLTPRQADRLFLPDEPSQQPPVAVSYQKLSEPAAQQRTIIVGRQKVAEAPADEDFRQAAVYRIDLPQQASRSAMLTIHYRGDVARLYADGKLVADNFYNGRPFCYALKRLPQSCRQLELRILPLQADMPVYLPREAEKTPGEAVVSMTLQPAL